MPSVSVWQKRKQPRREAAGAGVYIGKAKNQKA
jgi:hypothetical protein